MNVPVMPDLAEVASYVRGLAKPTVPERLHQARRSGRPLVQPRSGVGGHEEMRALLQGMEEAAAPDVLSLTIDSHTRLLQFDSVRRALEVDPGQLNGYPLVTHGWERGRELNEAVRAPLQVRHGSPDARLLFAASLAAGITSFEGGGIGYNVPYAKDVTIRQSLESWRDVNRMAGAATAAGVTIDCELFGTLTAVLVPPSISLAMTVLEAVLAAAEGVRCISIAYPQGGNACQDVAALRAIPRLAARYLDTSGGPDSVELHTVLHQFMGVFPTDRAKAEALITYGGAVAALGEVDKVVTKSPAEASGVPTLAENAQGVRLTRTGMSLAANWLDLDEGMIDEEQAAIEREVVELVEPVLEGPDLITAIDDAFTEGRLDVPFSASRFVRSVVIPARDATGAIRYSDIGALPLGSESRSRNEHLLRTRARPASPLDNLIADINYFAGDSEGLSSLDLATANR